MNSSNLSNVSNLAAKSLQDYKSKFQGISERSDRKKDYQITTVSKYSNYKKLFKFYFSPLHLIKLL